MSGEFRKSLAAKTMMLRELRDADGQTGQELLARVEAANALAASRDSEFDFVAWAGGSFWHHLQLFLEWRFIAVAGDRPEDEFDWRRTSLHVTAIGKKFIDAGEGAACDLLALFAPEKRLAVAGRR